MEIVDLMSFIYRESEDFYVPGWILYNVYDIDLYN